MGARRDAGTGGQREASFFSDEMSAEQSRLALLFRWLPQGDKNPPALASSFPSSGGFIQPSESLDLWAAESGDASL